MTAQNNDLRIRHYGSRNRLSRKLLKIIDDVTAKTKKNSSNYINLVFNYGGRDEILNSIKKLGYKKINTANLIKNLYTSESKDPDLIIRTGGEYRLSNFMLWQSAYSELIFIKKFWPEFSQDDFLSAIKEFNQRERRFGGL